MTAIPLTARPVAPLTDRTRPRADVGAGHTAYALGGVAPADRSPAVQPESTYCPP
ncbi:hypothetical protein [Terrabacter sp. BE26]|uniref:hypothetical protein n=1 Tax=Terrabacter sp. BE26 TaxID=2898152 RepID=UPI0035BE95AA